MRFIYLILSEILFLLSKIVWKNSKIDVSSANQHLQDAGYPFLPLWKEIPILKPNSKDLSIIIPVYNSESFIPKCLDAILNQKTKYDYEVICINDGSKDHSGEILKQYQEKYPERLIVFEQENQGISAARNKGIELAHGEYIGFIDNDDTVTPNYIEQILHRAKETEADIVQCGYSNNTINGELLSEIKNGDHIITHQDTELFLNKVQGYIWSGCLRKSLFTDIRFPIGFWYEDMVTRILLARKAKRIATINKALYKKTIHSNNASKVIWKDGNIKAVDQYWLAKSFSDYSIHKLSLPVDDILYNILLKEWTPWLLGRTRGLSNKIRESLFVLAADYLSSLNYTGQIHDKYLERAHHAFQNRNYNQWQMVAFAYLLKVKTEKH